MTLSVLSFVYHSQNTIRVQETFGQSFQESDFLKKKIYVSSVHLVVMIVVGLNLQLYNYLPVLKKLR